MKQIKKKFSMNDLKIDEMVEDESFLAVNAMGDGDDGVDVASTSTINTITITENFTSIINGLTTLGSNSTPENTYTEIDCC